MAASPNKQMIMWLAIFFSNSIEAVRSMSPRKVHYYLLVDLSLEQIHLYNNTKNKNAQGNRDSIVNVDWSKNKFMGR